MESYHNSSPDRLIRVYFIAVSKKGPIKIGFSNNPRRRLADLQAANPHELTLYTTLLCRNQESAQEIERAFHRWYADRRLQGEWFNITTDEIQADVNLLVSLARGVRFSEDEPINRTVPDGPELKQKPTVLITPPPARKRGGIDRWREDLREWAAKSIAVEAAAPDDPVIARPDAPDFNTMTPEQIIDWMESLATEQGKAIQRAKQAGLDPAKMFPWLLSLDLNPPPSDWLPEDDSFTELLNSRRRRP